MGNQITSGINYITGSENTTNENSNQKMPKGNNYQSGPINQNYTQNYSNNNYSNNMPIMKPSTNPILEEVIQFC